MGLLRRSFSLREMVSFTRGIAQGEHGGVPVRRMLALMIASRTSKRWREVLQSLIDHITEGATFTQAVRQQSHAFPPVFPALVEAGERAGALEDVMRDLQIEYEHRIAVRRKMIQNIAYPAAVLFALFVVIPFIVRIAGLLAGGTSGMQLLRFGGMLWGVFLLKVAIVVAVWQLLRRWKRTGLAQGDLVLRLPFTGKVVRHLALSRALRTFATLYASGIGLPECAMHAARATGNPRLEGELMQAVPRLKEGATLAEAFARIKVLPEEARAILRVGEESGKMDEVLRKAAQWLYDEAVYLLDKHTILLEPVAMLLLAGLLFGPMLSMALAVLRAALGGAG